MTQFAICKSKSADNYGRAGIVQSKFIDEETNDKYVTLMFAGGTKIRSYQEHNVEYCKASDLLVTVEQLLLNNARLAEDVNQLSDNVGNLVAENLTLKSKPCKKKKK